VQLAEKHVSLEVTPALVSWLGAKGYSREFGARNVGRLVEDRIKTFFVDEVLFGRLESGGRAFADIAGEEVVIRVEPLLADSPLPIPEAELMAPAGETTSFDPGNLGNPAEKHTAE
jgi:hypothetical protein